MRGYLSFLLVLAALAILTVLAVSYSNSKSLNFSKAIALERMEQLSLDEKRTMLVSAKYGAIAGFLAYLAETVGSQGAAAFDPNEAKERIKDGVYTSLLLIDFSTESDFQTVFWCGEVSSESELGALAEQSLRAGAPLICANCQPIQSPACRDFIDAEAGFNPSSGDFTIANLALGSENLGAKPKLFGVTIYSPKFNTSKVSYIPTNEKVFQTTYIAPRESFTG